MIHIERQALIVVSDQLKIHIYPVCLTLENMKWMSVLLVFALSWFGMAQNLVKNPSFEEYSECPNALGTFGSQVNHWSTPSQGSTDYFNTCSEVMGAPENFNGIQQPKFGNAYAGFYFFAPADYREYIQVELKRTLQKDRPYILEFFVSLAEGSDFAVKDFGIVLSYHPIAVKTRKNLSRGRLHQSKGNRFQVLEVNHTQFHEDKSIWLKIRTEVRARGFERYLTLGNLRDNATTKKVQTKRRESKKGAYYYIDMVSLTPKEYLGEPRQKLEVDSVYVFKTIHFDFDRFNITPEAEKELWSIEKRLLQNNALSLEIDGHTDNWGTETYNQNLSERRAEAIARYFLNAGIDANRISWQGHGSKMPVASNDTDKGRAKNRRVEFQLQERKRR